MCILKYSVGLPNNDPAFLNCITENKEHIYEVYFSFGDFPNGRSNLVIGDTMSEIERIDTQRNALKNISKNNIRLNLLFNGNCYGKDSLSRAFFCKIGNTVDYINNNYGLSSVTTTSPLIAKFIKNNFETLETRASVNMEIGSVEGMEYLSEYFDSYYMRRELNRDFDKIKILKQWCDRNSKKLFMLANSGCLNNCSAHNFHDNLVAREDEISKMDNAYSFTGICKEFLKKQENIQKLPQITNFVRPEDIHLYEDYFVSVKLATRVHNDPELVLKSYINEKYSGDILRILEPTHSIYPYVLENGEPLKLKRIDGI